MPDTSELQRDNSSAQIIYEGDRAKAGALRRDMVSLIVDREPPDTIARVARSPVWLLLSIL